MTAQRLPTIAEAEAVLARQKALQTTADRRERALVIATSTMRSLAYSQMSANHMRMVAQDALVKLGDGR